MAAARTAEESMEQSSGSSADSRLSSDEDSDLTEVASFLRIVPQVFLYRNGPSFFRPVWCPKKKRSAEVHALTRLCSPAPAVKSSLPVDGSADIPPEKAKPDSPNTPLSLSLSDYDEKPSGSRRKLSKLRLVCAMEKEDGERNENKLKEKGEIAGKTEIPDLNLPIWVDDNEAIAAMEDSNSHRYKDKGQENNNKVRRA